MLQNKTKSAYPTDAPRLGCVNVEKESTALRICRMGLRGYMKSKEVNSLAPSSFFQLLRARWLRRTN